MRYVRATDFQCSLLTQYFQADVLDPDWKIAFYGTNYAKLLSVKQKYDPSGTLYGSTSVGGDLWKVNSEGALCSV